MSKKEIEHFGPEQPLGNYLGHSVVHDDGRVDHFQNTGSIIPGEEYVGSSRVKREIGSERESKGGGGGGGSQSNAMLLLLLASIFFLLGWIALCVCPGLWLIYRAIQKKPVADPSAPPKFVGAGWVFLAMFMLVGSLGAVGDALKGLAIALDSSYPTGGRYGELIVFGIAASWTGSLVLGAIDLLRKNKVGTIVWVIVFLVGLEAFGFFVVYKNTPQSRLLRTDLFGTTTSNSGPEKAAAGAATVMQIAHVSRVAPRQTQTITIRGSGFGTRPAYAGDSNAIRVSDLTRNWNAGWANDPGGDKVTLSVASWTDTRIVIAGFGGAYGSDQNSLHAGDELSFQVWNAQSGADPATYKAVAASQ